MRSERVVRDAAQPARRVAGGLAALVAVIAVWSSWAVASRSQMLRSELGPWELGLLRFAFAGAAMLPVLLRSGLGGVGWGTVLAVAVGAGPGYVVCAYLGLSLAPAAHGAALTAGMLPLFTTVAVAALGLGGVTRLRLVGLGIMLAAATLFFIDGSSTARAGAWRGDLLLLGAPAMWSIFTVCTLRHPALTPVRATAIVAVVGGLLYLPVYAALGDFAALRAAPWPVLVGTGVFHGLVVVVLSLTLFIHAVRTLGAASTTLGTAVVPAVTATAAWLLLDEPITRWTAGGIALDAVGLGCVAASLVHAARRKGAEEAAEAEAVVAAAEAQVVGVGAAVPESSSPPQKGEGT